MITSRLSNIEISHRYISKCCPDCNYLSKVSCCELGRALSPTNKRRNDWKENEFHEEPHKGRIGEMIVIHEHTC